MLRKLFGPPVALLGLVLFGSGIYEYFFDPGSGMSFFNLLRGLGLSALLVSVGMAWWKGQIARGATAGRTDGPPAPPGNCDQPV